MSFLIYATPVFADHGSSGGGRGGGCSGDCIPPSMGLIENYVQGVSDGLIINDESFTVDHYTQQIPTQSAAIGQPLQITLNIYENSGAFYLSTVKLMLGQNEEFVGGQLIPVSDVQIVWEQTLDGTESFYVSDGSELISDVSVTSFVDGDPVTEKVIALTFSFTPTSDFDASPIVVNMWDHNRSAWTNYFQNALEIDSDPTSPGLVSFQKNSELNLPAWVKDNAGFWADGLIDDSTFIAAIKYCMDAGLVEIPDLPEYSPDSVFSFVDVSKGPQHYLDRYYNEPSYKEWFDSHFPDSTIEMAVGLDSVSDAKIPDWIRHNAGWWADGQIDDDSFVSGIKYLVENGILVV